MKHSVLFVGKCGAERKEVPEWFFPVHLEPAFLQEHLNPGSQDIHGLPGPPGLFPRAGEFLKGLFIRHKLIKNCLLNA